MAVDIELAKEIAEDLILDHATDVEYLSIYESFQDDTRVDLDHYTQEELNELVDKVYDLIRDADVEVTIHE